jgi:hypothetical protein
MASIIEAEMARHGHILPEHEGITHGQAADQHWIREPTETERDFIARIRVEAAAEGYATVRIDGFINVSEE